MAGLNRPVYVSPHRMSESKPCMFVADDVSAIRGQLGLPTHSRRDVLDLEEKEVFQHRRAADCGHTCTRHRNASHGIFKNRHVREAAQLSLPDCTVPTRQRFSA